MYHLNRIKYLILILLLGLFIPLKTNAIVKPTDNFYINDYANILSNEIEEYIMNKSVLLNNVDGTQIVVVTVPNLEGLTIEDYALQLFRNFGIGDKEKNNGLLLLLALEEREFRVEVGYGLEGILPDGKTGRFQDDYIIPFLKNDNWDEGIKNGYDAFYKEIVTLNNLNIDYNEPIQTTEPIVIGMIFAIVVSYVLGVIAKHTFDNTKNKVRNKIIYIFIIFVAVYLLKNIIIYVLGFIHLLGLLTNIGIYNSNFDSYRSNRDYSSSSFRSHSSSSRHSGGGGRSGGGGSSRRF